MKIEIISPVFKAVPKSQLADVNENIDYILNKKPECMKLLIRSDSLSSYNGYRFITDEDLTETIRTVQWFKRKDKNICIEFIFIRYYERKDSSFCPLYFTERNTVLIAKYKFGPEVITYTTKKAFVDFINSIQ